jgi:hypothetical protein
MSTKCSVFVFLNPQHKCSHKIEEMSLTGKENHSVSQNYHLVLFSYLIKYRLLRVNLEACAVWKMESGRCQ